MENKLENEYAEKDAFRVHAVDDHNMICQTCHSSMVIPLYKDMYSVGICIQTNKPVHLYERYQNEWGERYYVYTHIAETTMCIIQTK